LEDWIAFTSQAGITNEGLGWRWNSEFTMLEFYQAYAAHDVMN
jgi:lysyl-tRNA synthetase class II